VHCGPLLARDSQPSTVDLSGRISMLPPSGKLRRANCGGPPLIGKTWGSYRKVPRLPGQTGPAAVDRMTFQCLVAPSRTRFPMGFTVHCRRRRCYLCESLLRSSGNRVPQCHRRCPLIHYSICAPSNYPAPVPTCDQGCRVHISATVWLVHALRLQADSGAPCF
jgi:hypothetical protein